MDLTLPKPEFNLIKEKEKLQQKEMEILAYGADQSSSITASLKSNTFKGFYKPIGRLNLENIAESKKRARALILSKINQAIKKRLGSKINGGRLIKAHGKRGKLKGLKCL